MSAQPQPKTAPRAAPQGNERARLIRLVHVGRRELNLDDAAYRTILQAQGGAASSAAMSVGQLQRVVDYMKRQGFKVATKAKSAQPVRVFQKSRRVGLTWAAGEAVKLASDPESRKARALWLMLHDVGAVRDPSEAALLAYAQRQAGVERLEWVQDMKRIIEPLKAWALRSLPAFVLPFLQRDITTWAGHMSPAWRENWRLAVEPLLSRAPISQAQKLHALIAAWELISSAQINGSRS
ncbi:MAG: regulatory protein GemA [Hydrogenophaga sp.]|nr:regulatory protein GemA [Hydrogenophaga sp.]